MLPKFILFFPIMNTLIKNIVGKTEYVYVRAVEPSRLALEVNYQPFCFHPIRSNRLSNSRSPRPTHPLPRTSTQKKDIGNTQCHLLYL